MRNIIILIFHIFNFELHDFFLKIVAIESKWKLLNLIVEFKL